MISLIAAYDLARNIGYEGDMPWGREMKADLSRFKDLTAGSILVMGRKTFQSLPGILPDRLHYVLTTQNLFVKHPMVHTMNSIEKVLEINE